MSGKLFIISAPSGTGKTSVLREVMASVERLAFSISHTTRLPRDSERHGRDYYFVDKVQFQQMINDGEFLEWAEVHDNYYGTAVAPLSKQLDQGYDVVLDIDVQGAAIIRKDDRLPATYIFITPPSAAELESRLRGRGTEDEQSIQKRLQNASDEMARSDSYEYLIVNDELERAIIMMKSIVFAERSRERRTLQGVSVNLETYK